MQTIEDLRWDDLRVLLVLFRVGSLKRAAEELGVNISTASRRIDALEAAIGVRLFERTPDGTHPTVAAEELVGFAETMEYAAHGLMRGVQKLEAQVEGRVVITAPPGVVDQFLAPALVELANRHPRLSLTVVSTVGYADLTRREADIALRNSPPRSRGPGGQAHRLVAVHPGGLRRACRGVGTAQRRQRDAVGHLGRRARRSSPTASSSTLTSTRNV